MIPFLLTIAAAVGAVQAAPPPVQLGAAPADTGIAPVQLALAKEVVRRLQLRAAFLASLPAMKPVIAQQALAAVNQPGSPFAAYAGDASRKQQLATIVGEEFVKAFEAQADGYEDAVAQSYARRMTPDELTGLLAFLKTPSGMKWASIQPDITRDGQQIGASMGMVAGMKASAAALDRAKTEIK